MSPTLILTRGLPASGKTTKSLAWVRQAPTARARLCRDSIRQEVFGLSMLPGDAVMGSLGESRVTLLQEAQAMALLRCGVSVVIDDTNLHDEVVEHWMQIAAQLDATVAIWDLRHVPVEECVRRDLDRQRAGGRHVGEAVIRGMVDGSVLQAWTRGRPG